MGFGDFLYWATDKLKQHSPDITAVKNAYQSSCDLGYAAVTKIGNAVRLNGAQKVKEYVPDPQTREKIERITTNVAKYGADAAFSESLKYVTGVLQIYKIVREGLTDQPPSSHGIKKSESSNKMMEEMHKKMDTIQEGINNNNDHIKILLERIK